MLKKNIFSLLVAMVILYLSLASSNTFDKITILRIPHLDKIVHFGLYFILMSVIILENRKTLVTVRSLLLTALIPFIYGISLEILQLIFTTSRSGNIYDVVSNSAGIIASIGIWLIIKNYIKTTVR